MEIKKGNKFVAFVKRFGVYIIAATLVVAIAVTALALGLSTQNEVPVSSKELVFSLPMKDARVYTDFSDTKLQENLTLGYWEDHLAMDIFSQDNLVYSVLPGKVKETGYKYDEGNYIIIEHEGGFASFYSSLDKDMLVSAGDIVEGGQLIGTASTSATSESSLGDHIHFKLTLDEKKVDPNQYMTFQLK